MLEATGGLERIVIAMLSQHGLAVMRINPKRIRDFAKAHGLFAKTDALDAYAIALFGARMRPERRPVIEPERQHLGVWVARQRQLTAQRAIERTRLKQCEDAQIRESIERLIAFLGEELQRIEQHIADWIENSPMWSGQEKQLRSAPGVGPKTARVLLAQMPELGRLNRREAASLAGLAPYASESGLWRGKRQIRGGRSMVRAALYLASWSAIRVQGRLRDFYRRLVDSGKPKQVALIAVARKLLLALNEMLRTGQWWKDERNPTQA